MNLTKFRGSGVLQNVLARPRLTCPLAENLTPITFSKVVFLFTVFILGVILSGIIVIFEKVVWNEKDSILEKDDGKQCKLCKQRIPETIKVGDQRNIGQSVTIGTKNIIIH